MPSNIGVPIYGVNRNSNADLYKNPDMSIGQRVRTVRKEIGMSQEALATKSGIKQPTLSQLENDGSKGTVNLAKMAAALGVSALWLETGKGPKYPSGATHTSVVPVVDDEDNPDLFRVRKVKLRLSAGIAGFAVDAIEEDANPIYFRKDWFTQRGYNPVKLIAIKVKGESMEPSLYAGDTVVINTADTEPIDGEVFAVNYEGEDVIKRLVRDGGTWWLSSDNPDLRRFPRKECAGEMCIIIGRVVHKQSERI